MFLACGMVNPKSFVRIVYVRMSKNKRLPNFNANAFNVNCYAFRPAFVAGIGFRNADA